MNAITKNHISEDVLRRMTEKAFGKSAKKFSAKELSGGLCSAVYLVEANGEKTVLKIASESGIKVMRHEKMYVPAEAMIMKKLNETLDISMPQLLFYDDSGEFCGVPYFFMSYLRGKPLNLTEGITEAQYHRIKEQLGEITRSIYMRSRRRASVSRLFPKARGKQTPSSSICYLNGFSSTRARKTLRFPEFPPRICSRLSAAAKKSLTAHECPALSIPTLGTGT